MQHCFQGRCVSATTSFHHATYHRNQLTPPRAKRYERLMKSHGISPSAIAAPSPSKSDKGGDDSEPAAPASATKAGGNKRKSAAGKAGPKAAPNKRSRKKAAVASAERIVESDDKDEEDEDGGSEDKGDGTAGDAGIKQETDEGEEEVV